MSIKEKIESKLIELEESEDRWLNTLEEYQVKGKNTDTIDHILYEISVQIRLLNSLLED